MELLDGETPKQKYDNLLRLMQRYFTENQIAEIQTASYEEGYSAGYENARDRSQFSD